MQIKFVDARNNSVLAEYIDYDTNSSHYIWAPITNLMSLQMPLPAKTFVPIIKLQDQF